MIWKIRFTRSADKFLKINRVSEEEIIELIKNAVKKFQGEDININIKKLKGAWSGFYRIRKGKMRIIVEFDFDNLSILIEEVDWRGEIYQ